MDDREVEQSLREAWQVNPPDGMLERILARAQREVPQRRRHGRTVMGRFKLALVCVSLLAVLLANASEWGARSRMAVLTGTSYSVKSPASGRSPIIERRRELEKMLAQMPDGERSRSYQNTRSWQ